MAANPFAGKYTGGEQNQNDLVAWTSLEQGERNVGNIFAFQLPNNFLGSEDQLVNLAPVILKKVRWQSLAKPVFGNYGRDMFMGISGDQVRGWVGDDPFDTPASWASNMSIAESDHSTGRHFSLVRAGYVGKFQKPHLTLSSSHPDVADIVDGRRATFRRHIVFPFQWHKRANWETFVGRCRYIPCFGRISGLPRR